MWSVEWVTDCTLPLVTKSNSFKCQNMHSDSLSSRGEVHSPSNVWAQCRISYIQDGKLAGSSWSCLAKDS